MGKIVWLASYPKSGNTWLRILLTNLIQPKPKPTHFNEMDLTGTIGDRTMVDEISGLKTSDLTSDEIEELQSETYSNIVQTTEDLVYFKNHDSYRNMHNGKRFYPLNVTAATCYIVRNPLDVVVSYAHHLNISISESIKLMENENLTLGGAHYKLLSQLKQHTGSWSLHVKSWLEAPDDMKVHMIKYEDLLLDPKSTFTAAIAHIGLDYSDSQIERAVAFSQFETLKEQEKGSTFREKNVLSKSFFRKGIAGDWRNILKKAEVEKVIKVHGPIMEKLGYLNDLN